MEYLILLAYFFKLLKGGIFLLSVRKLAPLWVLLDYWSHDCFAAESCTVLSCTGWKIITFYQLWIDYLSFSLNVSLAKENRASNLPFLRNSLFYMLLCRLSRSSNLQSQQSQSFHSDFTYVTSVLLMIFNLSLNM